MDEPFPLAFIFAIIFSSLKPLTYVILFLGIIKLRDFERYRIVKWTAISMILMWFFVSFIRVYTDLWVIFNQLIGNFSPLFFSFIPNWIMGLSIPIALVFFGLKNRPKYGNYLVSAGLIQIFQFISSRIYINPYFELPGFDLLIFSAVILVSSIPMLILSSSFLIFFGLRIRSKYFIAYGILSFFLFPIIGHGYALEFDWRYWSILIYSSIFTLGIIGAIKYFELGKSFKRGVRVFISHSVDDFKRYRIEDIAKFLENQKGISRTFYCETDLIGNIDEWMQKIVPRCQILIFVSTEDSIISQDCITELNLAKSSQLQIVPVLGVGLVWDDLEKLDIHREFGAPFEPMKFEEFCTTIYERILKYKEAVESELPKKK